MRKLILWTVAMLTGFQAVGQDYLDRDSLWNEFRKSKEDTNRVYLFIQLGQQYENNNLDSALLLYEQALKLSTQLGYTRGIISYYTNATYVYNAMSRYDTSLVLNLQSVEIARAFGDPERFGACLSNTGTSYMTLKRYEKAIEYFLQALQVYEKLNDLSRLSIIYRNLAVVYRETAQLEKARQYGEQALVISRKSDNVYFITAALINLSNVYTSLGELTKSITLLEEARMLSKKSDNNYSLLITSLNLNDVYNRATEFEAAKKYADEALTMATQLDDRESVAIALRAMGIYYFNKGQPAPAEEYARRSLRQALEFNYPEEIGKSYSLLAEISILKGDFKNNTHYSFKSDSIQSVLLNESIARNMQELEIKYESEKKEQQIKDLQQEARIKDLSLGQNRLLISILMGSLLAVLIIAWLARRNYQQKNALNQSRIAELESEKQLMASEAIIKGQEEERGRLAKDLHDGLGGLLSGVKFTLTNMKSNMVLDANSALLFERSLDMLDNSITELRRVAHNMMPEVLVKFGLVEALKSYCQSVSESGVFQINFQAIGMENRIESGKEIILYRIVQELLNNAAKHAKATEVLVQVARQNGEVIVTVEDNGSGFDAASLQQAKGSGWTSIRSRVEYLKGKVDIQSAPGKGTSINITIPV